MTQPYDEREARKQYIRHRQRTVFTAVGAAMAVILVVAMLFFFHVPCAQAGEDGTAVTVSAPSVTIRVLNGTEFSGFAQAVGKGLENRGFTLQSYSTYQDANGNGINNVERTTIYFGRNSINQAYTLNDNFTDAIMVMDDREDELIDVVLGATFKNLKDLHEVSAPGSPIQDFATCQPADQMTDLPAAIAH